MKNNFGRFSENPQYICKDMIGLLKVRHRKSEQLDDIALRTKVDQWLKAVLTTQQIRRAENYSEARL
jgi:hypothetical protein